MATAAAAWLDARGGEGGAIARAPALEPPMAASPSESPVPLRDSEAPCLAPASVGVEADTSAGVIAAGESPVGGPSISVAQGAPGAKAAAPAAACAARQVRARSKNM